MQTFRAVLDGWAWQIGRARGLRRAEMCGERDTTPCPLVALGYTAYPIKNCKLHAENIERGYFGYIFCTF